MRRWRGWREARRRKKAAAVGRQVVEAMHAYERRAGRR